MGDLWVQMERQGKEFAEANATSATRIANLEEQNEQLRQQLGGVCLSCSFTVCSPSASEMQTDAEAAKETVQLLEDQMQSLSNQGSTSTEVTSFTSPWPSLMATFAGCYAARNGH